MELNIEAERKLFEAWAITDDGNCCQWDLRKIDGGYCGQATHRDWLIWQARAALAAPQQDQVMVDIGPPATQRDHWMYEQGRLAERDPRSHPDLTQAQRSLVPDHVWKLAEEVWCDLDRTACPAAYMQAASESIIKRFKAPAAPVLSDHDAFQIAVAIRELEWADVPYPTLVTKIRALLAKVRP